MQEVRKNILFYTQVCYLDIALEYIRLISQSFHVHVVIELPASMRRSNILDINVNLAAYGPIVSYRDVKHTWNIGYLGKYLEHCASVHFAVYPSNRFADIFRTSRSLISLFNRLKVDYYHLDDLSPRLLLLIPHLYSVRKKLILNVHDPKQHKGEFELKRYLLKSFFFRFVYKYMVYSDYSKTRLSDIIDGKNKQIVNLKMMPYTVFSDFKPAEYRIDPEHFLISFIGRISSYKGINVFIEAAKIVNGHYPEQKFMVAGKRVPNYQLEYSVEDLARFNILINEKYLSNSELTGIVLDSSIIVCPYQEATQSGVVMTAHALERPVLVTNCGGLPENIEHGETGLIAGSISAESVAENILYYLNNNLFKKMEVAIHKKNNNKTIRAYNLNEVKQLYSSI